MVYWGMMIYMFSFLVRPADWWKPMVGFPIDSVILGSAFFFVFLSFDRERWEKVKRLPHLQLFLAWIIWIALSNSKTGNIDAAIDETVRYLKYLAIFFLIIWSVRSYAQLKGLILWMAVLIALMGYQGIDQVRTGIGWAGQPIYWGGRISWVGPFDGANILALMFVLMVPFLIDFMIGPWGIAHKLFALVIGYAVMTGLLLANSRGGYLSLIATTMLFFAVRFKRTTGIALGGLALIGLLLIAPSRFGSIDDKEKSSRGRIDMWSEAIQMVSYNPVLGIGKGQFSKYTGSLLAHNAFLQNLGETGLVGAFIWLCLIYATIKSLLAVIRAQEDKNAPPCLLSRNLLISFFGFLIGLLFISADFEVLYVWIALCATTSMNSGTFYRLTKRDYIIVWTLLVVGVLSAYVGVNVYKAVFHS